MRISVLVAGLVAVAGAVLALLLVAGSALAVPEGRFSFLFGPEGFDGSLPAGEPLLAAGAFSLPFFDVEDMGAPDTQAGSHPYALTIGFASANATGVLAQYPKGLTAKEFVQEGRPYLAFGAGPTSGLRDATVGLPRGLVVNPDAVTATCTGGQLSEATSSSEKQGRGCPSASVVGVASVFYTFAGPDEGLEARLPVYRMQAPRGVPAEFGFNAEGAGLSVVLKGGVRTGGDYGLFAQAGPIIAKLPILGVSVTLWGDPTSPAHDGERGYCASIDGQLELEEDRIEPCSTPRTNTELLTLPSACSSPLSTTIAADSWQRPGVFADDSFLTHGESAGVEEPVGVEGCSALAFTPSIKVEPVEPEVAAADSPSGLRVNLHVPQSEQYGELAEANLKDAVVTLPEGMTVNPAAAGGREGCPLLTGSEVAKEEREAKGEETGINLESREPANCPGASKIGTVEVNTPLLENPLPGMVYLAKQAENPFGSLLAIYVVVDDPVSGVVIKLAGDVQANPSTGRLTTTFDENPELPFLDLKLDLFGGPRAALITPAACGAYTTETSLTPWSGTQAATPSAPFEVSAGCATGGFAPSFSAGTTSSQAGAFSPFSVTFSRQDGEQRLSGVQVTMPPGLLGKIAGIAQCPEPQANSGECGEGSLLGEASAAVGAGPDPYWVSGGKVYLTGPYDGGPFGLSIVVPTSAGPFTLTGNAGFGKEVVRTSIRVNPNTAQITVLSDPLPSILEGIPLDIRTVNVTVNRAGFMFNPTDCEAKKVEATLGSAQGASVTVSSPFKAANCATLPFKPALSVSTSGHTSKADGASLNLKVTSSGIGQANLAKFDLTIPKILSSRLSTLQKACTEAQFNANPAGCPTASDIGTAIAHTQLLNSPLTGPAYLVSHGNAAFPDVEIILQGEGVTVVLDGHTQIKDGVTYSRFETIPDAPFSSFEFNAPEGPYSIFTTEQPGQTNLCQTSTTKTVTVTKKETKRVHGKLKKVTVKAKKTVTTPKSIVIPTTMVAQNGAVITENPHLAVTGCPAPTKTSTTNEPTSKKLEARKTGKNNRKNKKR